MQVINSEHRSPTVHGTQMKKPTNSCEKKQNNESNELTLRWGGLMKRLNPKTSPNLDSLDYTRKSKSEKVKIGR